MIVVDESNLYDISLDTMIEDLEDNEANTEFMNKVKKRLFDFGLRGKSIYKQERYTLEESLECNTWVIPEDVCREHFVNNRNEVFFVHFCNELIYITISPYGGERNVRFKKTLRKSNCYEESIYCDILNIIFSEYLAYNIY
ncbi:MAG: hypothetical protein GY679_01560 [Mycoplasma sp.]|nr:hypothetical protein [Mycoplasma sp.]